MTDLKKVLIERDGLSSEEADNLIDDAKENLMELLAEGIPDEAAFMNDWFSLEPDYILDLL